MKSELKLSVNTGFALNRFTEIQDFSNFCERTSIYLQHGKNPPSEIDRIFG